MFFTYAYRSLKARFRANAVTMLSICLFVTGSCVGLSVYLGMRDAVLQTSPPEDILVLSTGAVSEGGSKLDLETARKIPLLEGIKQEGGAPLAARELVSSVFVNTESFTRYEGPKTIRGIDEQSLAVHHATIIEGTAPSPGTLEIIVGDGLRKQHPHLKVGSPLHLPGGAGTITGVFQSVGGANDSEVWTPRSALETHLKFQGTSSVTVVAESAARVPEIVAKIKDSKDLEAVAFSLREYRIASAGLGSILKVVLALLVLLSIVAASAIATTMNAAVIVRLPELAALVAVGIRRSVLGRMVMVESILLAAVGAILGLIASQVVHGLAGELGIGRGVIELKTIAIVPVIGFGLGILMGVIGGLVPVMKIRKLDVIQAMR